MHVELANLLLAHGPVALDRTRLPVHCKPLWLPYEVVLARIKLLTRCGDCALVLHDVSTSEEGRSTTAAEVGSLWLRGMRVQIRLATRPRWLLVRNEVLRAVVVRGEACGGSTGRCQDVSAQNGRLRHEVGRVDGGDAIAPRLVWVTCLILPSFYEHVRPEVTAV